MTVITIDNAQLSTILAALRTYQNVGYGEPGNRPDDIHEIATNGGEQISLDAEGIDALCEQINCSPDDDEPKCLATLTPEEDAAWVKSFNAALEKTGNDDEADRIAWAEIVQMFPRLAAFDGCKPDADDSDTPTVHPFDDPATILRTLVADLYTIKGYWTEGIDNTMRDAERILARQKSTKKA